MKKLLVVIALLCAVFFTTADAETLAGRMWESYNLTALISPELSFTVMPGVRWEFGDDAATPVGTYFEELFVGPTYTLQLSDNFKVKLPVWYYFMGFPSASKGTYNFSHNLEIMPTLEYKINPSLMISSRSIFHNTFYASMNNSSGWSTLLREMVLVNYTAATGFTVFAGDEIFVGLITDPNNPGTYGPGFSPSGLDENRIYAGFTYKISPEFSITSQYIYSTTYKANAGVNNAANGIPNVSAHNFYLTMTYLFKTY